MDAQLSGFIFNIASTGQIGNKDTAVVTDKFRLYMLISGGIFCYRTDMHTAFMGKGTASDKRS